NGTTIENTFIKERDIEEIDPINHDDRDSIKEAWKNLCLKDHLLLHSTILVLPTNKKGIYIIYRRRETNLREGKFTPVNQLYHRGNIKFSNTPKPEVTGNYSYAPPSDLNEAKYIIPDLHNNINYDQLRKLGT
ncbi:14188_t:CDS:1, partial [Racocetra fulgida]